MGNHYNTSNSKSVLTFLFGIFIGFAFALLLVLTQSIWQMEIISLGNDTEFHDPHSSDQILNVAGAGPIKDVG